MTGKQLIHRLLSIVHFGNLVLIVYKEPAIWVKLEGIYADVLPMREDRLHKTDSS